MEKLPPKTGSLDNIDYKFGMKPLDRGERVELLRPKTSNEEVSVELLEVKKFIFQTPDGRAQIAANDNPRILVDSPREICSRTLVPAMIV